MWVGEGAIIMANIGNGCQIAAGAVVTNDTKSFVVLAGNPARFVKTLAPPANTALTTDHKKNASITTESANAKQS